MQGTEMTTGVTEFLVTQWGRKDRTQFYRDHPFASGSFETIVRVFSYVRPDRLTKHSVTETILRGLASETSVWKPDLNRPDRLKINSVTGTILTSETIIWKPGLNLL